MNYQSIEEIYEANDKIREKLKVTVSDLTERQATTLPEGEKWTVAQIVEHVSMVEDGMTRICSKLLAKAKTAGQQNGGVKLSENFLQRGLEIGQIKIEAPEIVRPVSGRTIAESLAVMDENRAKLDEMRPLFETFDCNEQKFPHPFFGDISAAEWLALVGGHEARHIKQIKKILEKIGQ